MFRRISMRLSASIMAFLVLILASYAANHYFIGKQSNDTLIVNLVVRQQLLVERIAKYTLVYANTKDVDERLRMRDSILSSVRAFDATMSALRDGGAAPLDLSMTRMKETSAMTNAASLSKLDEVTAQWTPYKENVEKAVESDQVMDAAALGYVTENDAALIDALVATADTVQEESEGHIARLISLQMGLLGIGVLLVVLILWATWKNIGLPLRRLVEAAEAISKGDLDVEINTSGPVEIEELAESFDRMRVSIRAVLEATDALGDDIDDL